MRFMKYLAAIVFAFGILQTCPGMTVEEYLAEADELMGIENYDGARALIEKGIEEHPESSALYTRLGVLYGIKVQLINDFTSVFQEIIKTFDVWDKALDLDPDNIEARFQRGIWGVNVPKFLGRTEGGVQDLDYIIQILHQSEDPSVYEQLIMAYYYVAYGLQRLLVLDKAKELYNAVIEHAPQTDLAAAAQENLVRIAEYEKWRTEQTLKKPPDTDDIIRLKIMLDKEPDNIPILLELSQLYRIDQRYDEAVLVLQRATEIDWANPEVYKNLALVFQDINVEGYNPRIALDTDFRTDLAFEAMRALDMAVELAPNDLGLRFIRGIAGIEMPFFTGTLEQGINDLALVLESSSDPGIQAQALYYLGFAHHKKTVGYWGEVAVRFSDQIASKAMFDKLKPAVKRLDTSSYEKPYVVIDFLLGFKDELAPQTAVWIEDDTGKFVKSIYVSGFSGFAKGQQVNLPVWAQTSQFLDADAVTSASIDLGHHIYVWNLIDYNGKKVKKGKYIAKVEVTYWPSMLYQRIEAPFELGKKGEPVIIQEGNFIPYLEVRYEK